MRPTNLQSEYIKDETTTTSIVYQDKTGTILLLTYLLKKIKGYSKLSRNFCI